MREASSSTPCSGSSAPPAPPRMRAVSVAKYQPPASSSLAAAVGDHATVRQQDRALGTGRGELGIVRRDDHRLALLGAAAQLQRELGLGLAVHAARGLVQREHRREGLRRP